MKSIKYIICLLLLNLGVSYKANCQQPLQQSPAFGSGPYAAGTIITIPYEINFTEIKDNYQQLKIEYDANCMEFVSNNFSAGSNMFHHVSGPGTGAAATIIYQTNPFTLSQNGYAYSANFTVSFRIINALCSPQSCQIKITHSTFDQNGVETFFNPQSVGTATTVINIANANAVPSVSIDLVEGVECYTALYKITSYGYEDGPAKTGTLKLTLPDCAIVQSIFNTSGQPVAVPTPTTAAGFATYEWQRSGVFSEKLQYHYVLVKFNCNTCSQLDVEFDSYGLCGNNAPYPLPGAGVHLSAPRMLNCCSIVPDVCTAPPCSDATIILPPNSGTGNSNCNGGVVMIKKWLVKTPFRYLPSPDNCITHDYFISIANVSCYTLKDLNVKDMITQIAVAHPDAILVTGISATLTPIIPSPSTSFGFSLIPNTVVPINMVNLGSGVSGTYAVTIPTVWPMLGAADIQLAGVTDLPAYSTLLIKITHTLNDPSIPPSTPYINKAIVAFSVNNIPYSSTVAYTSLQDKYEPVIVIDKKVRNLVPTAGSFVSNINASPGEAVEFAIKIRNYGMRDVNAVLNDIISNPLNNFFNIIPSSVAVTETSTGGQVYTAAELATLQNAITAAITATGFNSVNIAAVKAGVCKGVSELTITYTVKIKKCGVVKCSSEYVNTASLNWDWNGIHIPPVSGTAKVNIDLFKSLTGILQATCIDPAVAQPADWKTGNISAMPGQTIWYRAKFINQGPCDVNGLKMMVLLPDNPPPYSSQQNTVPNFLNASCPALPAGTGLYPVLPAAFSPSSSSFGYKAPGAIASSTNWLNSITAIAPGPAATASGNVKFIYQYVPTLTNISSNNEAAILYKVVVPVNNLGQQYNTSFGYSINSTSTVSQFCQAEARKSDLMLTISNPGNCGSAVTGCDLVKFETAITRSGSQLQIRLFNILDMNGIILPNINSIDVIVQQPYWSCPSSPSLPYSKKMIGFSVMSTPPVTSTSYSVVSQPAPGSRMIQWVNNNPPGSFGDATFVVNTSGAVPPPGCGVLPINIVFKNNDPDCPNICEKMIYLKF